MTLFSVKKKSPLKVLNQKVLHFALQQFWDLKIHIYRLEEECESLLQNGTEIVNITEPLKNATDAINGQFDKISAKLTQNVTTVCSAMKESMCLIHSNGRTSSIITIYAVLKRIRTSFLARKNTRENHDTQAFGLIS